jgi:hypothetical protein
VKRSPLKAKSSKRRKLERTTATDKAAFLASKWLCECCNKRKATQIHHIANGASREATLVSRCACLLTCSWCNVFELEDKRKHPVACQLKMLQESRPNDYDLAEFHRLRGSKPSSITEKEVSASVWDAAKIKLSEGWSE